MVIIFDLDDTLYPEITYVQSGFRAVSNYIALEAKVDSEGVYQQMLVVLKQEGRGKVFNLILEKYKLNTQKNVLKCLGIYRKHTPKIKLPDEVEQLLLKLKKSDELYIVTDGNKLVQSNKIKALGVNQYVKKAMPTHNYGVRHAKPSTYCFEKIKGWEKCEYKDMVYIGDNPNKDFVNLKPLGMHTIRIRQGMFKEVVRTKEYEADCTVSSILELTNQINRLKK